LVNARAGGVKYVLGKMSSGSHCAGGERNRGCGDGSNGGRRRTVGKTAARVREVGPAFIGKAFPSDVAVTLEMLP
jgi:hypothetical protein